MIRVVFYFFNFRYRGRLGSCKNFLIFLGGVVDFKKIDNNEKCVVLLFWIKVYMDI